MVLLVFIPVLLFMGFQLYENYYANNIMLFQFINGLTPGPDWLWQNITFLGDGLPAFIVLVFFLRKFPSILWYGLVISVVTGVCLHTLKQLVFLARPAAILGIENIRVIGPALYHHSFPSGHSLTAFSVAALFIHLTKGRYQIALLLLASLISWSRVVVGAHWPSDVIIGALLGWYGAKLAIILAETRWRWGMDSSRGALSLKLFAMAGGIYLWWYAETYQYALVPARTLSVIACWHLLQILLDQFPAAMPGKYLPLFNRRPTKSTEAQ
ncbi:MAG TPA: phosphatase PAP2 family protein [Cellvibrio sp.]